MPSNPAHRRSPAAAKLARFGALGVILTLAAAWLPFLRLTESSPAPRCSRAWPVSDTHVGVVFDSRFDWWLPVDRQTVLTMKGSIADDPDRPGDFMIFFTGDTWAVGLAGEDLADSPPKWCELSHVGVPKAAPRSEERVAAGWPLRCFEGFEYSVNTSPRNWTTASTNLITRRQLPVGIMWLAFAADVLFWSLASYTPGTLVRTLRRRRRNARGLCLRCGYPRSGIAPDSPCPECGHRTSSH